LNLNLSDLTKMLYLFFSQYGPILDIVVTRCEGMRGQAFVVYTELICAANAMREAQNNSFFNKQMVIQYAQKKSKSVALLDGTFMSEQKKGQLKERQRMEEQANETNKRKAENEEKQASVKKVKPTIVVPTNVPPNKVLFVQNLPENCSDKMLQPLFQTYPGFKEVRLVPGGKGMAFVEFANDLDSGRAMVELQGFRITLEHPIYISFRQQSDSISAGEK